MSLPNENGVYNEGLEMLSFLGKHSNMQLSIAHCEDKLWRYGLSGLICDSMDSLEGFGYAPKVDTFGYSNRDACFKEACSEISKKIKKNADKNPLASKELTAWVNSLLYESRQMSLF